MKNFLKYKYLLFFVAAFIFFTSFSKAEMYPVNFKHYSSYWSGAHSNLMYDITPDSKKQKCPKGYFMTGISWYNSPDGFDDESAIGYCTQTATSSVYSDYNIQNITNYYTTRLYSVENPALTNSKYYWCNVVDGGGGGGLNPFPVEVKAKPSIPFLEKAYAIAPPSGSDDVLWECRYSSTYQADIAPESSVSTLNNPVYLKYFRMVNPVYNYYSTNGGTDMRTGIFGIYRFGYTVSDVVSATVAQYKNDDSLFPSSNLMGAPSSEVNRNINNGVDYGYDGQGHTAYDEAACPDGQVAVGLSIGVSTHPVSQGFLGLGGKLSHITKNDYIKLYCRNIIGGNLKVNTGSWWILPELAATQDTYCKFRLLGICFSYGTYTNNRSAYTGFTGSKESYCPRNQAIVGIRFYNSPDRIDDEHIAIYCKTIEMEQSANKLNTDTGDYEPLPPGGGGPLSSPPSILVK